MLTVAMLLVRLAECGYYLNPTGILDLTTLVVRWEAEYNQHPVRERLETFKRIRKMLMDVVETFMRSGAPSGTWHDNQCCAHSVLRLAATYEGVPHRSDEVYGTIAKALGEPRIPKYDPYKVACPSCYQPAGAQCINMMDGTSRTRHRSRVALARRTTRRDPVGQGLVELAELTDPQHERRDIDDIPGCIPPEVDPETKGSCYMEDDVPASSGYVAEPNDP